MMKSNSNNDGRLHLQCNVDTTTATTEARVLSSTTNSNDIHQRSPRKKSSSSLMLTANEEKNLQQTYSPGISNDRRNTTCAVSPQQQQQPIQSPYKKQRLRQKTDNVILQRGHHHPNKRQQQQSRMYPSIIRRVLLLAVLPLSFMLHYELRRSLSATDVRQQRELAFTLERRGTNNDVIKPPVHKVHDKPKGNSNRQRRAVTQPTIKKSIKDKQVVDAKKHQIDDQFATTTTPRGAILQEETTSSSSSVMIEENTTEDIYYHSGGDGDRVVQVQVPVPKSVTTNMSTSSLPVVVVAHNNNNIRSRHDDVNVSSTVNNDDEEGIISTTTTTKDVVIDVLSVGSLTRKGLTEVQRQTWASHKSVRQFVIVTEEDEVEYDDGGVVSSTIYDPEPQYCHKELQVDDVLNISTWCRNKYGYDPDNPTKINQDGSWVMKKWIRYFGHRRWLKNKDNPVGWMCAQKRFATGLAGMLRRYRTSNISLPDSGLLLVDDDTYVNLPLLVNQELIDKDLNIPYVGAGCRVRRLGDDTGLINFSFGGFGTFFSKGSLERLVKPIYCKGRPKNNNVNDFNNRACERIAENLIGEEKYFHDGMTISDLMDARARAETYRRVDKWNDGFCFHGDHYLATILHLYGISENPYTNETMEAIQGAEFIITSKNESSVAGQSCHNVHGNCDAKTSLVCHYQSSRQMIELHEKSMGATNHPTSTTVNMNISQSTFSAIDIPFEDTSVQHKTTLVREINKRRRCYEGVFVQLDAEWGVYIGGFKPNYASGCDEIQFWNIFNRTWVRDRELKMPDGFPNTHHAVSYDRETRFLYLVSGQMGGGCNVASRKAVRIHVDSGEAHVLPDLPEGRYAAGSGLVRVQNHGEVISHLHVFGGASILRNLTAREHWRLKIPNNWIPNNAHNETSDASAVGLDWEKLEAVPDSNAHTVNFEHNGYFYHGSPLNNDFGVQETESIDVCRRDNKFGADSHHTALLGTIWRYPTVVSDASTSRQGHWERVQDMPLPAGQALVVELPNRFLVVGGSNVQEEDGGTATVVPNNWVRAFDPNRQEWEILSPLASPTKFGGMAWYDSRADSAFVVRHNNNRPRKPLFNEGKLFRQVSSEGLHLARNLKAKYLLDKKYRETAVKGFQKCVGQRINASLLTIVTFLDDRDTYTEARSTWNIRKNHLQIPDIVTYPSTTEEVGVIVQCAKRNGYKVCARNGKHSFEGDSSCAFGVVVDVAKFNEIRLLDYERGKVRLGAGLTLGKVAMEVEEGLHLVFPMGHCATVGLTGLILVGGQGVLSRHMGMTVDYISAIEFVDQNGILIRANETNEHSDVLWLARGGGSGVVHFPGIITSIETDGLQPFEASPLTTQVVANKTKETTPKPKVYTFFDIHYEASVVNAARLCAVWQEFYQNTTNIEDPLFSRITIEPWLRLKPKPRKDEKNGNKKYQADNFEKELYLAVYFFGNDDSHNDFMENYYPMIVDLMPNGNVSKIVRVSNLRFHKKLSGVRTIKQLASGHDGWDVNKRWKGYSAVASDEVSIDSFRVLAEGIYESQPYTERYVELKPLGGAIAKTPRDSTAFWHRDARWWLLSSHTFLPSDSRLTESSMPSVNDGALTKDVSDSDSTSRAHAIMENSRLQHDRFINHMSTSFGGLYSGYIDHGNSTGRDLRLYYGNHAERIADIKLKRDPHNVFSFYHPNAMDESWYFHQKYDYPKISG